MSDRKRRKRFHLPGHFHELTFSCYRRFNLLNDDVWRMELCRLIDVSCDVCEMDLTAFVLMPNHVHLLIYPKALDPNIGRFLATFKQPFSKFVKERLLKNNSELLDGLIIRERPGKFCFRFWQEGGGYDRNLYDPAAVESSVNYIHMNPVKKSLCQKATQWKWSSAKFYEDGIVDPDLPPICKPPAEFFTTGGIQVPKY